ncbi:MAG: IS110 family transposase [Cytophagaceae bacterium]|nr:IS110 family transposase [Gemmatimonadaceae bacterium]
MEVVHDKCAGLDVHQHTVVACVRVAAGGKVTQEVRTFDTTTKGLLALCDWLAEYGCTHAAMESTGVFWKPVWHVLESSFELVLANAMHIRNLPGRKTDVNDAMWIADLLAHGLIRASFVPPTPVQELRDLTRTRKQLVREIAQHTQRIQKTLEDANIKITGVISNVLGMSGRTLLDALVAGETDPERLVELTRGRLKASRSELVEALRGRVRDHHRFLLKLHLAQIDALTAAVRDVEGRVGETLTPFRERTSLLTTMPGISETTANVIVSEIGIDMSRFPTAGHLVSWAGLCPRNDESAGKRRSTRLRKGAPWLKTSLVQAAWGAVRKKDCYLRAQFLRLKSRRGPMKAIVAVAASMLTAAYHILRDGVPYRELTGAYFDKRDRSKLTKRLLRRLADIGVHVDIRTVPAP